MRMHICPLTLKEANVYVANLHRHHPPVQGHRFSLGLIDDNGYLHGVAIAGRPVARLAGNPRDVLEVTRLCTDGTRNACSMLYAAIARTARAMGFLRVQTYTLPAEGGESLRAAGWRLEGIAGGGSWNSSSRPRVDRHPVTPKHRWSLDLGTRPDLVQLDANIDWIEGSTEK